MIYKRRRVDDGREHSCFNLSSDMLPPFQFGCWRNKIQRDKSESKQNNFVICILLQLVCCIRLVQKKQMCTSIHKYLFFFFNLEKLEKGGYFPEGNMMRCCNIICLPSLFCAFAQVFNVNHTSLNVMSSRFKSDQITTNQ